MGKPYRTDYDALKERLNTLEGELARMRGRLGELEALGRREPALVAEIDAVKKRLEGMGPQRPLPMLDRVRIASPCSADWASMQGDDRVRFCGTCEKNVYNLTAMTAEDAVALLEARGESACVRFYRRGDGTMLTADCPVGARKKGVRRGVVAVVGGSLMAAGFIAATGEPCTMGKVAGDTSTESTTPTAESPSDPPPVEPPHWAMGAVALPPPETTAEPSTAPTADLAPPAPQRHGRRARPNRHVR